jgi:hypothetical protein
MRGSRHTLLVVLAGLAALGAVLAPAAGAQRTVYKGQFQCDDRGTVTGLPGMNVELWKRGESWLPVEWVGSRVDQDFTDAAGNFSMTTPESEDNYFVRMALRDAKGVHLRDFWGINDWSVDTEQKRNNVRTRDYGGLVFSTAGQSHKCAIWAGVRDAYEDYREQVSISGFPWGGVEIQADAVTAGVPFTPGTSILWPGGFPVGYGGGGDDSITRHEFGHVIRHGFDGDFGHFLGDVVTHNYLQNHEACNRTGLGFAFNEGWAEFWAEDFAPAPDCGRPGDMETEGNVAAALTELMANCAGNQRRVMVEVLQRNPGTIHSFAEFRDRLGCPIPRLTPVFVVAARTAPVAPPVTPTLRADAARDVVTATSKRIKGLQARLGVALDKAEDPPRCVKDPCKKALKALTRPVTLEFEIKLAKIQLNAAAQYDTAAEQAQSVDAGFGKVLEAQEKQETRDRKKAIRAALTGIKEALEAAAPVFKEDSSKSTSKLRRALRKAAARYRKAAKKGSLKLPPSLRLQPPAFNLPDEVPRIPSPPETPFPGPTVVERSATALTISSCPGNVVSPKPIEVAGTLTPAQAGSDVKVAFSHPVAGTVVVVARTDAAGNWSAAHTPGDNQTGVWSVDATFGGDLKRLASSAPTCETKYS